jgi:hypothetical protein
MIEFNMVEQFAILILMHLMYDFHWQGDFVGTYKAKYIFILFIHCLTWALFLSLGLKLLGIYTLWKFMFLFTTHIIIDLIKITLQREMYYSYYLIADQFAHLVTLIIVFIF